MRTAVARFLQYLAVERNASSYTVKSYREDLTALTEYLAEARGGRPPAPGDVTVFDLRGFVAALHRVGLRQDDHRPAPGLAAELLSFWPAGRLGEDESRQAAAESAQGPVAAALPLGRRVGPAVRGPAGRRADGPARSGDPGDDVFGGPPRQRGGGLGRQRLGFPGRRAPRAGQGPPRTPHAGRILRPACPAHWLRRAKAAGASKRGQVHFVRSRARRTAEGVGMDPSLFRCCAGVCRASSGGG